MRIKYILIGAVVGVLLTSAVVVLAGSLDSTGLPGATSSYNLDDIYNRLNAGTTGSQSAFAEPAAGPGSTGHTLDDVMGKAPAVDDTNGAGVADVATGKTFWGLNVTAGEWGLQTGTATVGCCTCSGTLVGTRWCDNGDGTVTDMLGYNGKGQCLVWLKKADWGGQKNWEDCTTHDNAHTRAGILYDGLSSGDADLTDSSVEGDWRLPTKTELYGLTHGTDPVLSGTPRAFTGVQSYDYWSSTAYAINTVGAWCVDLDDGNVNFDFKNTPYYVWPVRGGQ